MLVIFDVLGRIALGYASWPVEVKMVSGRIEIMHDVMDKGPKIAGVVEPGIEDLTGVGRQVDNSDLCKKNIEDVKISGLVWVKEAISSESGVPVVKSDSEIAEATRKPIAIGELFSILDDTINEVTEAANPSELRLPAVRNSAIISAAG